MNRRYALTMIGALMVAGGCSTNPMHPMDIQGDGQPPKVSSEPPAWEIGDLWRWSDGYGLKVTGKRGGLVTFVRTDDTSQWIKRRGLLLEERQSTAGRRRVVFRKFDGPHHTLFPLEKGKTVRFVREYTVDGERTLRHLTTWQVKGVDTIFLPALSSGPAPLTCWLIERHTINPDTDWSGKEVWWYSPEIRNYARMEYQYGDQAPGSRVLIHYALQPTSSSDKTSEE